MKIYMQRLSCVKFKYKAKFSKFKVADLIPHIKEILF